MKYLASYYKDSVFMKEFDSFLGMEEYGEVNNLKYHNLHKIYSLSEIVGDGLVVCVEGDEDLEDMELSRHLKTLPNFKMFNNIYKDHEKLKALENETIDLLVIQSTGIRKKEINMLLDWYVKNNLPFPKSILCVLGEEDDFLEPIISFEPHGTKIYNSPEVVDGDLILTRWVGATYKEEQPELCLDDAKPVLFNTEMVKALLDGKKTSTRRVIKVKSSPEKKNKLWDIISKGIDTDFPEKVLVVPKYEVGDILYVRETFVENFMDEDGHAQGTPASILYRADGEGGISWLDDNDNERNIPWKPSIHMPKKYARIFLKVTKVKVERLQDITEQGIEAEGFNKDTSAFEIQGYTHETVVRHTLLAWWKTLWDSTAPEGYKWEDNPYVFVYEFERI